MPENSHPAENKTTPFSFKWTRGEPRPLTTDERASFVILALYMGVFCISSFLYWDSLSLKILGVTAAAGGIFLFVASIFNTEAREKSNSKHPVRSYLVSFFIVLMVLFLLRLIGGVIDSLLVSVIVLYAGLLVSLIVFRKALVQVITTMLAVIFLFVTFSNSKDILSRDMSFNDAIRQSGHVVFQIGPIQDVVNLLISGNYMNYLNRIDYRDPELNIVAIRTVKGCEDDDLRKTEALLSFVSNEIHYVSDPNDGLEHARDPIITMIAGGGDCEDQTLLLCSLLESVGVRTYIVFTDEHVFALVRFPRKYPDLKTAAHVYIDGEPCYALDASDRGAVIGRTSAVRQNIKRIFDVRRKAPVQFTLGG